jgi:hypothetical protein
MPLSGLSSNIERIDSNMLQEFLIRNLTPNKCIISGIYLEIIFEKQFSKWDKKSQGIR